MHDPTLTNLITAIHDSEHQAVLAITGGGSGAISQLLQVPGASRTVLEAVVPYASAALTDWLGSAAQQSCSESTARAMAMAAWMRARQLAPTADPHKLVGVGATASLVSDRPKRAEHRVHVATQTATATVCYSLRFAKDQRARQAEEALATNFILLALAETCEVAINDARQVFDELLLDGEEVERLRKDADIEWTELLLGKRSFVGHGTDSSPQAIFPGAFNPPHSGHREMVNVASTKLGCPVAYELSITNVDKPPLDFIEIDRRLGKLQGETASDAVVLTDAPTFRAKAKLFPGCTFVVGADTIQRVGDPKYYTGAEGTFEDAIGQIATAGCRFLVFGREIDGKFCVLADLQLPPNLYELCDEVSVGEFREDVSSTVLREESQS